LGDRHPSLIAEIFCWRDREVRVIDALGQFPPQVAGSPKLGSNSRGVFANHIAANQLCTFFSRNVIEYAAKSRPWTCLAIILKIP